jgi:nucleotide-binding universal stress UspA family protein
MRNPSSSSVVVGVTGTSAGLAAVRLAAREAVARGRNLRIVHAFTWHEGGRRDASRVIDEAVATAQRSTPRVRVTGQLVDGPADQVLIRLSRAAELVVLGDDDLATTPWLPPGSVLVQTVARAWCPVLVARGPRPPGGPLLAAVDGSPSSLPTLRHAAAEAVRRRAPIEVVHVTKGPLEAGRKLLAEVVAGVPELARARTRVLPGDAVGPVLVRESGKARMIVLGPRGEHDTGLLGSVARELLHRGACPTFFIHGRTLPAQRIPGNRLSRPVRQPM